MDPIDLSSFPPTPPSSKQGKRGASTPIDDGIHRLIREKRKMKSYMTLSAPQSPSGHRDSAEPRFACPFHKYDPKKFNSKDYECCAMSIWTDISNLAEHIHSMHLDKFACPRCTRRFDSESGLQSHHEEMMAFGGLLCPVFSQDISLSIHEELSKMRRGYHMWGYHRRRTAEEEWQIIYQLLFPNDGRTLSPFFESSVDRSEHVFESAVSYESCDVAPLMTPAPSSEEQPALSRAYTSTSFQCLLEHSVETGVLERGIQTPQAPVTKELKGIWTSKQEIMEAITLKDSFDFPKDRCLEDHKIPLTGDASPFSRETRSPTISPLPMGDDFGAGLSTLNSKESPSSPSDQSMESFEEDETQLSDFDGIDSRSRTCLSFDPVKRALLDNSTRQFWNFFNGLSFSDWTALWIKHATYKGAVSSSQDTHRSTSTTSDTQTPPKISLNSTSSLAPKRKIRDDQDDANNNRNPSKRPDRTSVQKERLNLACPFHKHKPKEYNHGILRFRTCSTTRFDAICRLREHLRRVHPARPHCTRCWQSFDNQNSLVNHGQADIPCQRSQPVSVQGWTTEMDKKVTKRKDETEPERWGRIYRELFGRTVADLPSPYFEPYNLPAANGADLETILHREVPRIVSNMLREQVNNMDIPDAARALFDPSAPYFQFDNLIGSAIREVFATIRSARGTANNAAAPPTPQSSSANPYTTGDSSTAQSATGESTPIESLRSSHHQLGGLEYLPAVAPNNTMHPIAIGEPSYSGHTHEQAPPLATELPSHASETASNLSPPNPPSQLQSGGHMQQGGHYDEANAYGGSISESLFDEFDLDGSFDYQAFLNMSSGPDGAPACS